MKIILLQDEKKLGKKGDIIEASDGYARNYILPKKIGVEATAANINDLKLKKANDAKVAQEHLDEAKALAADYDGKVVVIDNHRISITLLDAVYDAKYLANNGKSAEEIAMMALEGLEPNVLDDFEVNYRCDCTKERVERALISLGNDQLEELAQDKVTEVKCHFCDKVYQFTSDEVLALRK